MKIDKLVQFFFTIAEQNVKKEEINFLKKIFFYFDEGCKNNWQKKQN